MFGEEKTIRRKPIHYKRKHILCPLCKSIVGHEEDAPVLRCPICRQNFDLDEPFVEIR